MTPDWGGEHHGAAGFPVQRQDRRRGHCGHAGDGRRRGRQREDQADSDEESESSSAWDRETDPSEEYIRQNLHTVDLAYPLSDSDFGSSDYRLFLASLGGSRDIDVQNTLVDYLAAPGRAGDGRAGRCGRGHACWTITCRPATAYPLSRYLATLPADQRAEARLLWQEIYSRYPGALHAAGTGDDLSQTAVGFAVQMLIRRGAGTPSEELENAVQGMQSANARTVTYWFRQAMDGAARRHGRLSGRGRTMPWPSVFIMA